MSSFVSHPIAAFLALALCVAVAAVLVVQYRSNRLLFRCLVAAIGLHVLVVGYVAIRNAMKHEEPPEVRIKIAKYTPPPQPTPPPKVAPKPKPQKPTPRIIPIPKPKPVPPTIAPPKGNPKSTSTNKIVPKGHNLDKIKAGKPNKPSASPKHSTTTKPNQVAKANGHFLTKSGANGVIADNPDGPDNGLLNNGGLGNDDFSTGDKGVGSGLGKEGKGPGGENGEDAGSPDGSGDGDVPRGFKNGKVGGRMYYVRLKYGSGGAWNAHWDGTKRLLAYLNKDFKCEDESRAMSATELDRKYMRRGEPPTFLYIYCDDSFSLNSSEVSILQKYMQGGGFLFLDSRNDSDMKAIIKRQLDKVLPGSSLAAIPRSHPINRILYRLTDPGYGENFSGPNYGVTRGGRLVVFYTAGNFSAYYSKRGPEQDYDKATYQMGANVMLYAMLKGDASGVNTHQGASGKVTQKTLEQLGFLDAPAKSKTVKKPGETVKIKPKPGQENQPEDVKVLDD